MKRLAYWLLIVVLLAGCKAGRRIATEKGEPVRPAAGCLASKVRLTLLTEKGEMSVSGLMKMKSGERIRLSLLMPVLRTEMVRVDVAADGMLVVDRTNRRYVRATAEDLKRLSPGKVELPVLERKLVRAAALGEEAELTGKELGIPSLEGANLCFYGFSSDEFTLSPTKLSAKYVQVPWDNVIEMIATQL